MNGLSPSNASVSFVSKIIKLNRQKLKESIQSAKTCLVGGGVVALPTDTVYGVATLVHFADKLYEIKGRNKAKPLALCFGNTAAIKKWAEVTISERLLEELLPGPVTLVFKRTALVPHYFNPNTTLVGVRIPDYDFIQALCNECDSPVALTSANISDTSSSLSVIEFETLHQKLDLIIDGGKLLETPVSRAGSTVIDLSVPGTYKVIRDGSALHETVKIITSSKYNLTERL